MALIKCPECQKEISEQVKTCPHCGFRINKSNSEKKDEPKQKSVNQTNINIKKRIPKSIILAGIVVFLCIPLNGPSMIISFTGIIWALIELVDEQIKNKVLAVASLILFIFTFIVVLSFYMFF